MILGTFGGPGCTKSLPKGSLPRLIGTIRGHEGLLGDYWGLLGLIGAYLKLQVYGLI